jgi:hypothetical protein
MDLKQKLSAVATGQIINISELTIGVKYPIVYAIHMMTSILLILNMNGDTNVKVYLPQRYATVCTERDIESINNGIERWKLVYRGVCCRSNQVILSLEI